MCELIIHLNKPLENHLISLIRVFIWALLRVFLYGCYYMGLLSVLLWCLFKFIYIFNFIFY